jgi:hypothetical protein
MDINGFNSLNFDYSSLDFNRNINFKNNNELTIDSKKDTFELEFKKFGDDSFLYARGNYIEQSYTFDIASTGYDGKAISKMTPMEAKDLISEKGFFGIENTANRVASFVLDGAGDNLDKLQSGREGLIQGYKDAEKIWGDTLPEISQETFKKTLEMVDEKIKELGGNIIDEFV